MEADSVERCKTTVATVKGSWPWPWPCI